MSAFSCGPGRGSEPGVGWNMALETARLGHDVLVMTQSECRAQIERAIAAGETPPNLHFDIFTPKWLELLRDLGLRLGLFTLTWHSVNICWQLLALRRAQRLYRHAGFDMIHHVTLAGIRHPTLLGRLRLPMALGPLGGGERAPLALRRSISPKEWTTNIFRDFHSSLMRFEPLTRAAFHDADVIFLRSAESLVAVPCEDRGKVIYDLGMGVDDVEAGAPQPRVAGEPLRLIYVGRLVYWKGVHLAIRALANARRQMANATLTIIGDGPARAEFGALAERLGVAEYIVWRGEIARSDVFASYAEHHALLFPSLHDAAATATLEALAHSLPVICLRGNGLGLLIDETCGFPVSTENDEARCVSLLSAAIVDLAENEERRMRLSAGARARFEEMRWPKVVARLYAQIEQALQGRCNQRVQVRETIA